MTRIRAAAVTEFSLHGLLGTSTQAIATRAGLTKQQLHYYITGKDELYDDLLEQVFDSWKVVFSFDGVPDDPASVLSRYIRQKLDSALDYPEVSRMFTREVLDGGHNLARFWATATPWLQQKVDVIDGWIARGRMRRLDARLLLLHIWSMTQGYADSALQTRIMLAIPPEAPFERERIAQELIGFVLAGCGLSAPPPGNGP